MTVALALAAPRRSSHSNCALHEYFDQTGLSPALDGLDPSRPVALRKHRADCEVRFGQFALSVFGIADTHRYRVPVITVPCPVEQHGLLPAQNALTRACPSSGVLMQ